MRALRPAGGCVRAAPHIDAPVLFGGRTLTEWGIGLAVAAGLMFVLEGPLSPPIGIVGGAVWLGAAPLLRRLGGSQLRHVAFGRGVQVGGHSVPRSPFGWRGAPKGWRP